MPLATFAGHHLVERPKLYSLTPASRHLACLASFKVQTVGLPVLRKMRHHLKPTTVALQRFGQQAIRHRLELTRPQLQALLRGEDLPLCLDAEPGYMVLFYEGDVLGCGLYMPGRLRSQIPRRHTAHQRSELL